jgi:hypothetical protein
VRFSVGRWGKGIFTTGKRTFVPVITLIVPGIEPVQSIRYKYDGAFVPGGNKPRYKCVLTPRYYVFSFSHLISSQSQSHQQITTRFTRFIPQKSPHDSQSYIYKNQHSNHSHECTKSQQKSPQQSHVLHKINTKIITSSQNHQIEPPNLHHGPSRRTAPARHPPPCAPLVQFLPVLQG